MSTIARVEFSIPADLTQDELGNVLSGRSVTAKLAGTATNVTHYSALTGGTSTTGGLVTHTDGTIVDGSGNRRYVDSGISMDITISGQLRQVEAWSGASGPLVETTTTPTLYVTRGAGGSDSNDGLSPGRAMLTLEHAVATLNQGLGGKIVFRGLQVGPYSLAAPLHFVRPITVEGMPTHDTEIDRTFGTSAGRSVWDAVTTAAGSSVTSATAAFVAGDIGKIVSIYGAGTGGGTYYDFISATPSGTSATLTGTTPVARNSTTDPKGVKLSVVGDWSRVVTDAAMTAATSIVTSATAAFTDADIGTEIVIAGAGHGNQALRTAILSRQSSTQVTVLGTATNTVSGKRCAIGVVFGDMITFHVSGCGLKSISLYDRTTGQNRIGAALKTIVDDGTSIGAYVIDDVQFGSTDAAGAWEHALECDGSWNQSVGPGVRQVRIRGPLFFGTRRPTETIRLNSAVHWWFTGGGIGGAAPTTIPQGMLLLDPQKTAGSLPGTADVHFAGVEAITGYYYCEGQYCTFHGGRLGGGSSFAVSGRVSVELSAASDSCSVNTVNVDTRASQELDSGTNNVIRTNRRPFIFSDSSGVEQFQFTTAGRLQFASDANAALYRAAASLLQTTQNFCAANTLGVGPGAAGSSPTSTVDVAVTSTSSATFKLRTASWGSLQITANGTSPGAVVIQTTNGTPLQFGTNGVNWLGITTGGDVIAGGGAKTTPAEAATNATAGFLYIPTVNGVPSGTPAAVTGGIPIVYDRANNQIYLYNGAWKKTVALT